MSNKPAAQVAIDATLVRRLVAQAPGTAELPLVHADDGWDCSMWRLGDQLAVRLPRRVEAVPLLEHESRALADIGARVEATGIRVPTPVFSGAPIDEYPWPWSIVPWIVGVRGLDVVRADRLTWAAPLARAVTALHSAAPADHPINPVRGIPLIHRDEAVTARIAGLRATDAAPPALLDTANRAWRYALEAPAWAASPVWIHGDLHPGNIIAIGGSVRGIIDFGDATGGDPAYDLAIAWLAFEAEGRAAFIAQLPHVDDATWVRSRGWAAAIAVLLLSHSDDAPAYASLAHEALAEIASSDLS